jgi:pimeloyl-ACP methyl ester carboxylesterase
VDRYDFDDVELTYEMKGRGAPVVLVHASAFVSWYVPLVEGLADLTTLRYRRRLRPSESGGYRSLTVADDAAICGRLMDHVGWPRAHIVGHSYGALVALQLAMDAPERVGSIALLEPAARGVSSSVQVVAALEPVVAAYRSGDTAGAVDAFLRHVGGDGYRAVLDRVVPDASGDALAEADLFFQVEMPAVTRFRFGPSEAARITAPVLNVVGTESVPRFREGGELVQSWFPQAERLTVPRAGHLLMVQNPAAVAEGLRAFHSRHPLDEDQARVARRSSAAARRASGV